MLHGETGSTASSTSHVVIQPHIVVYSGDLVSALIGGSVVLLGVFVAEAFVRLRERRRRLNEAAWNLQGSSGGGLLSGRLIGMSTNEVAERYGEIMRQLGRIRADAKWPIKNAKQIAAEVDAIMIRFMVAVVRFGTQEDAKPPQLGPVLGSKLLPLVLREGNSVQVLDEALKKEGLPTLAEVTTDDPSEKEPAEGPSQDR